MINYNGLSEDEVINKRKLYGSNELKEIKKKTIFKIFIESLGDPIIKILLIALGIKMLFIFSKYDWYETIGIAIAAFLASLISTLSEYGSETAFKSLMNDAAIILVKVKRNGILKEISINDIVTNDLVYITTGDSIPADGIIVKGNLLLNEASLTGESKEVKKRINNKVFRGTIVTEGDAYILVTSVGNNTEYGKIYKELQEKEPDSPLKTRLYELAKIISKIGYMGALIVSLSFLFNKIVIENNFQKELILATLTNPKIILNYLTYALTLAVTIIIVAVPEGLPMMITLVLSSNMKRMLKDNVLVRKPLGIETCGNINYLLTDKTGTLTKGKLEVLSFNTYDNKEYKSYKELKNIKIYDDIYNSIILNNESKISEGNVIGGNYTDKSLITFLPIRDNNPKIIKRELFNSDNKYSALYLKDNTYYKGAPEVIISKCNKYIDYLGNTHTLSNKDYLYKQIEKYSSKGIRVIALAKSNNTDSLEYLGFVTLKDDIRKEATLGIKNILNASINVIMITGDNYNTSLSIAKEVGIINTKEDIILNSNEFSNMDEEEILKNIKNIKVIARALPKDKSRLVNILQNNNYIVGMTGDGVNDAPALKKANVGFSMGSGTEVAKEASDIVILDNNILSISKAILYGRTIFKSIRRFVIYQLTVNMSALLLSIIGSFIGISTPITIIQMLWLNMIMDTFAGLAFSFEYPLSYYMELPPKEKDEPIINKYMYSQIIINGFFSFLICVLFLKLPIFKEIIRSDYKHFMTAYFALFIFIGIVNAFLSRTERLNILSNLHKNKVFLSIFIFILVVQIILIYYGKDLFRTYGLTINELLFTFFVSFIMIPIDLLRKIIIKKNNIKIEI